MTRCKLQMTTIVLLLHFCVVLAANIHPPARPQKIVIPATSHHVVQTKLVSTNPIVQQDLFVLNPESEKFVKNMQNFSLEEKTFNCPVSSQTHFGFEDYLHYPLELFDPSVTSKIPVQQCSAIDIPPKKDRVAIHYSSCSKSFTTCPVTSSALLSFTSQTKQWLPSPPASMCALSQHLKNNQTEVNVIVFGNSITRGVLANLCCLQPKCNIEMGIDRTIPYCNWPMYLNRWMNASFDAKVTVHNLAVCGYSSKTTSDTFSDQMENNNITQLSNKDIIFLDHAIVDDNLPDPHSIKHGLVSLIQQIYAMSGDNSPPTVVILNTMTGESKANLTHTYKIVAEMFDVLYWSYSDTVDSYPHKQFATKAYPFIDYLSISNHMPSVRHNLHPAWYTHLFYADLIGATMAQEFRMCDTLNITADSNHSSQTSKHYSQHHPHSNSSSSMKCNPHIPKLLHVIYDDVANNKTLTGSFNSPNNTWRVTTDLKGRGGFIRQLNATSTLLKDDNGTLTFTADTQTQAAHIASFMLSVLHLKSYNHAGLVDVLVCGQKVGFIDALWSNHETFKYSVPQMTRLVFSGELCATSGGKVSVDIVHRIQISSNLNRSSSSVHTNSSFNNANSFDSDLNFSVHSAPRFSQMFKISSVSVCQLA